jgi:hypothetical protein
MESHKKHEWYKACLEEVRELETQGTYKIIDLPKDKNITPIKGRWVFKKKPIYNPKNIKDSYIVNKDKTYRYKAR